MQKKFNITGNCRAKKHYMADVSKKLEQAFRMVEDGDYFIINRPRQYGKTTMLFSIAAKYNNTADYATFNLSFEGIGDKVFETEPEFCSVFVGILARYAGLSMPKIADWLADIAPTVTNLDTLSDRITDLANKVDKNLVLIIDEVDKSSNNQLFISFLAMLRNKYLNQDDFKTFHSVVLAGVHDVKSLKLKMRPDEEQKYNSPWNIAADFEVDMNLQVEEIVPMLDEYAADKDVKMDTQDIAERLFYYTSGYPFLVSKLCKMMDEKFLPQKTEKEWTAHDIEIAAQALVKDDNTNFDTLIKNLENNPELYEIVHEILIKNENIDFDKHNPKMHLSILYGMIVDKNGKAAIHNRIYSAMITNYMASKIQTDRLRNGFDYGYGGNYKNDDKTLNMEAVMLGFQAFMKKEYSKKDRDFLEKNGRLVFLAFLKPIINGSGYDFKEPQISEEKRLDVVITYFNNKYVAELKIWYGEKAHQKGLLQLVDYLNIQGLDEGYLLIFDHSETKNWQSEWREVEGKRIFAVWV
jgi:AAA-like domain